MTDTLAHAGDRVASLCRVLMGAGMEMVAEPLDTVEARDGLVTQVHPIKGDSDFRVLTVEVTRGKPERWVGTFQATGRGTRVKAAGSWRHHPRFGDQFVVQTLTHVMPTTVDGIARYLGCGIFTGIGEAHARRIADRLGAETFAKLTHRPEQVLHEGVAGVPPRVLEGLVRAWSEHQTTAPTLAFLAQHGIGSGLGMRILKKYGADTLDVVRENPWRLAVDIDMVGFARADAIAMSLQVAPDHPGRAEAAVMHVLRAHTRKGHVYAGRAELVQAAAALIAQDPWGLDQQVEALLDKGRLRSERLAGDMEVVYPTFYWKVEARLALRVRELLGSSAWDAAGLLARVGDAIQDFEREAKVTLAPEQRQAVEAVARHNVVIITGGPGVGKTTLERAILFLLERARLKVLLCAPTGRAAKRMGSAARRTAVTIHAALGARPGSNVYVHHRDNPLATPAKAPIDALLVDEASMLDMVLSDALLQAVPDGARVVLIGDADQLPSVGAGAVLRDLIASEVIPTVHLKRIYRQAAGSAISVNAHRINHGEMPVGVADGEFQVETATGGAHAADILVDVVTRRLPAQYGFNPMTDIQVLLPQHRGRCGTVELNARLQAVLNPRTGGAEIQRPGFVLRVGDKVMHVANNRELALQNGDMGWVSEIDLASKDARLKALFDDREVTYNAGAVDQLVLGYAVTCHKSQGSEYPGVVVGMVGEHHQLLGRNLLYTAVTRGKQVVVLVSNVRTLRLALDETRREQRNTRLAARLRGAL